MSMNTNGSRVQPSPAPQLFYSCTIIVKSNDKLIIKPGRFELCANPVQTQIQTKFSTTCFRTGLLEILYIILNKWVQCTY